jgi:hypothetical protein
MPTDAQLPAPPAKFFWFLPTNGDSRSIVGASPRRRTTPCRPTIASPVAATSPRWPVQPTGSA